MEQAGSSPRPETPSTLTETEGEMEGILLEVDLDSYQTTLEEVLTWLLSAEDALQIQDEVSDDVEEVKEQFHTHEVGGDLRAVLDHAEMQACMHMYTKGTYNCAIFLMDIFIAKMVHCVVLLKGY